MDTRHDFWQHIETLLTGQLAPSSLDSYQGHIAAYLRFAKEKGMEPADAHTLLTWRNHLQQDTQKSPHTINRQLSAVKRVILEARRNHLIDRDTASDFADIPNARILSMKDRLKKNARTRISPEDMRKLCETPDASTLAGMRDRAILLTLASSGVRASELTSLTIENIRPERDSYIISICGKEDILPRDAHLSKEARLAITEWMSARNAKFDGIASEFVFSSLEGNRRVGSRLTETAIWQIVKKYSEQIGLASVKPHDFRRFVGTQLARTDIRKAQIALGHADIQTTAKHYILDKLEPGETDHLF